MNRITIHFVDRFCIDVRYHNSQIKSVLIRHIKDPYHLIRRNSFIKCGFWEVTYNRYILECV